MKFGYYMYVEGKGVKAFLSRSFLPRGPVEYCTGCLCHS